MGSIMSRTSETDLHLDPSLQSFDTILRDRTNFAIQQVSTADYFSLNSFRLVIGSLVDINEQVVQIILQSKEDIWHNPDLRDLVNDYFDNTTQTLALYSTLEKSLLRSGNSLIILKLAISRFEAEKTQLGNGGNNENPFEKTLRELKNFKSVGDPFTDEFFTTFRKIFESQDKMLKKLQAKTSELDKKLKGLKSYRKVSAVLFGAGVAALVICSVVAVAVFAAPSLALTLGCLSSALYRVRNSIDLLFNMYINEVREEVNLMLDMHLGTTTAVRELEHIKHLVEKLKVQIEGMVFKAGLVISPDDEVAVSLAIEEITKNLRAFEEAVHDLGDHSNKYSRKIITARNEILQRIKNLRSSD